MLPRAFLTLVCSFFKIGLFTIGGGLVIIPLIQREMVTRGWMTTEQFLDIIRPSLLHTHLTNFLHSFMPSKITSSQFHHTPHKFHITLHNPLWHSTIPSLQVRLPSWSPKVVSAPTHGGALTSLLVL